MPATPSDSFAAARFRAAMPADDGLVIGYATPGEHAHRAALEVLLRSLPPSDA
ncbi:hypothetical protein ABZZ36_37180 [Actinacidiphila glaucinigra]|uniref:hypothetical protein n=1 Tax=Actinacidiphila glaucinigra TaxID=235986 RepID=UPI0033A2E4D8